MTPQRDPMGLNTEIVCLEVDVEQTTECVRLTTVVRWVSCAAASAASPWTAEPAAGRLDGRR